MSMKLENLLDNQLGAYRILPGGAAYCTGIVPYEGFEVVRIQLRSWLPLDEAYAFIEEYLRSQGRPIQAFCGIEMRVPEQLTLADWSSFNAPYLAQLRKWGLLHGDYSGVCRSNIALASFAPQVPSMCAFSFTAPASAEGVSFCLSGTADLDLNDKIIAEHDIRPAAMRKRTQHTIAVIGSSLSKLGLSWKDAHQLALFHVCEIPDLWEASVLGEAGEAVRQGVIVYRGRPPIVGGEVELEARGNRRGLTL